jgi:hypothetical protein
MINNNKAKMTLFFVLSLLAIFTITLAGCLTAQPVVSLDVQATQISYLTAVIATPLPEEILKSSELTNGVVMVGVVLVLIIVGGTFLGIRRLRLE